MNPLINVPEPYKFLIIWTSLIILTGGLLITKSSLALIFFSYWPIHQESYFSYNLFLGLTYNKLARVALNISEYVSLSLQAFNILLNSSSSKVWAFKLYKPL